MNNVIITTNDPLDLERFVKKNNLKGNPPSWEKDFIKKYGLEVMSEEDFNNKIEEFLINHPTTFSRKSDRGRDSILKTLNFSKNRWFKVGIFQRVSSE